MDTIYIIKALMLGTLGAGGFYFLTALVFHYFPLPFFLYARTRILTFASKKHQKKGDFGDKIWGLGRFFIILGLLIFWWGLFVVYAWNLNQILRVYLPDTGDNFWTYYGLAIALPLLVSAIQFVRFFFAKAEPEFMVIENDDRPLLEQLKG